jgi:predicted RNA-binding Zn ribbon-like protein
MVTYDSCIMLKETDQRYNRFRFDAGGLSLNFVATVRHRGSHPRDLLATPESLLRWLQIAGLASSPSFCSSENYEEALFLREAIHNTLHSLILNQKPNSNEIDAINKAARFPISVPQLNSSADSILRDSPDSVKACLAIIARDAITLMGDTERHRLKICTSDSCQMLFWDFSPGKRRRWCAMSICGNRRKIALHRQRLRNENQK